MSFALAELYECRRAVRVDLARYSAAVAKVLTSPGEPFRARALLELRELERELRARWVPQPFRPQTLPPIDEMGDA